MIRNALTLAVAALVVVTPVEAGRFNKKLSIGDPAPSYSNLPGTDGKMHSLSDLKNKEVVVVVVTCNHCPVAVAYEDRIIELTKKYATGPESKVGVVAINVNNLPADRLDKMKERSKSKGFNFTYLYDETQKVGREFGATVTPEFFVLDKTRKVAYMGALDDSMQEAKVKTKYLENAIEALLAGKPVERPETAARGCSVKYEKK